MSGRRVRLCAAVLLAVAVPAALAAGAPGTARAPRLGLRLVVRRASGVQVEPVRVAELVSFGQDAAGELYAVSLGGAVYRLAAR